MRIDDHNLANMNASPLGRTSAPDPAQQQETRQLEQRGGNEIRDKVSLSSLAANVQSLQPDSAARETYLAELSAEFRAGRLESDAERIADALIGDALEEGGFDG
ncbi:MAG: flagellar biosynthesis anti-sigma factor FlgM [Bryobacteraceae bacterium]|nr:flagellar biosynthesis anti-sigma factor FlgM [Bryobacteraceae bacterium]